MRGERARAGPTTYWPERVRRAHDMVGGLASVLAAMAGISGSEDMV